MATFAGFTYPKFLGDLPKFREYKKRGWSISRMSSYRSETPIMAGTGTNFYLASDLAPGLRWQWADQVPNVRGINHKGWCTNEYGDSDTIRGVVFRLNHGKGFLAGWSMGEGMASTLEPEVIEDIFEAAHRADRLAELAAEHEREYQEEQKEEELREKLKNLPCVSLPGLIDAGYEHEQAQTVMDIINGRCEPTDFSRTNDWVNKCWNTPDVAEQQMYAIDEVLALHGVEAVEISGETIEYCNTGDTYGVTVIHRVKTGELFLGSWGDLAE